MATASGRSDTEELMRFAREHHLSYDVEEEPAAKAPAGKTFEVRLFATHGEDKLEAPGCPRCVELTRELHSFATSIVSSVDAAAWADIMESPPVLYASTDQHGPDQVSLVLRVFGERPDDAAASDGHMHRIEDSMKALGISRR